MADKEVDMKYQVYRKKAAVKFRGGKDISPEEIKRRLQEQLNIYMALPMGREKYVGGGWWQVDITDPRIGEPIEASSEEAAIEKMSQVSGIQKKYLYAQVAN